MTDLAAICREAAEGLAGAKALPFGGLRFARRGFEARVDFPPDSTDILFDTRDLAVEAVQVAPAGLWHDLRGLFGRHDFQTGDAGFDPAFEVVTSREEFAARVLTEPIRNVLRKSLLFGRFFWRLSRAGFLFRARGWPASRADLDRWLMVAFQLLDALPGSDGRDRPSLGPPQAALPPEATCQVCGMTLSRGVVVSCRRCATPHHKDCWEFNGRCSIFACGEIGTRSI
jgi:hypothetical protein